MKKIILIICVCAAAVACETKKSDSKDAAVDLAGEVTPTNAPCDATATNAPDASTPTGD